MLYSLRFAYGILHLYMTMYGSRFRHGIAARLRAAIMAKRTRRLRLAEKKRAARDARLVSSYILDNSNITWLNK